MDIVVVLFAVLLALSPLVVLTLVALWAPRGARRWQEELAAAWRPFCDRSGAQFIERAAGVPPHVRAQVNGWSITLDAYQWDGSIRTRVRARYRQKDNFRFALARLGTIGRLAKPRRPSSQATSIGDPEFEQDFSIWSNDVARLQALVANPRVRELLQSQPPSTLMIQPAKGGLAVLEYVEVRDDGVLADVERLQSLLDLFGEVLDQLARCGVAEPVPAERAGFRTV